MESVDKNGDNIGEGYNDWKRGRFVKDKDKVKEHYYATLRKMNIKMGERYSEEIESSQYGAYIADDPSTPFYLVEWVDDPRQAKESGEEEVNGKVSSWEKGDWLCRGAWLERFEWGQDLVHHGPQWTGEYCQSGSGGECKHQPA